MKLYIKQKVFSWMDRFTVFDETGADKYHVEGEFFSWGKKLYVTDLTGHETAFIQQKVFSMMPRFFVYIDGVERAEIVKRLTFFYEKYEIEGLDWTISGRMSTASRRTDARSCLSPRSGSPGVTAISWTLPIPQTKHLRWRSSSQSTQCTRRRTRQRLRLERKRYD